MPLSPRQRFTALAHQTNRQYAHAVVYGGLSPTDAATFGVWVLSNGLNSSDPAENLALWLDDDGDPD